MDPRTPLVASGPGYDDVAGYSTIMGELQHLVNCTRPDIARAVSALSSYTKAPTQLHWDASMQVVRYLHGTWSLGIVYGTNDIGLQGWTDADFMGDTRDTRSTTGMVFTMYGGAVTWQHSWPRTAKSNKNTSGVRPRPKTYAYASAYVWINPK